MLNTLKELCLAGGVSGDEEEVRRYIEEKAAPHADSVRTDAIGNLIVFKKGKKSTGNKLMLAAHMDEVGIIITRITDEGFLKFDFVGGVDRRVAIGKPVVIGKNKVPGVIGLKAVHLVSREERKRPPRRRPSILISAPGTRNPPKEKWSRGTMAASSASLRSWGTACSRPGPSTTGWAAP